MNEWKPKRGETIEYLDGSKWESALCVATNGHDVFFSPDYGKVTVVVRNIEQVRRPLRRVRMMPIKSLSGSYGALRAGDDVHASWTVCGPVFDMEVDQ